MGDLLSNPTLMYGAVGVLILIVLVVFLVLRSRRSGQKGEGQIRKELAAMQQESQITDRASQVPFTNSPELIATQIADIFREYVSIQLFKIYAGRDGDGLFNNVLPKGAEGLVTNDLSQAAALPVEIPAAAAMNYTWPQTANINALIGDRGIGEGEAITVVPWRGPFGWSGLMVGNALPIPPNEVISRIKDPLVLLNMKLGVALELANSSGETSSQVEAANLNKLYEMMFNSDTDSHTLQAILREVTRVSGANSAALWRLDQSTKVLKMESAFGLQGAEFLPQPLGQGLAGTVMDSRIPLDLEDAPSDPRCLFPQEARESGVGSYLGIPLMANGSALGVLEVHTIQPKWWDEQDLNKLEAIGKPLTRFLQQTVPVGRSLLAENAYLGLSEALQMLNSPAELMHAVVEVLGHALGASRVMILDLSQDTSTIEFEFTDSTSPSGQGITLPSTILQRIRRIIAQGLHFFIADSPRQSLLGEEMAVNQDVSSELAIPIKQEGNFSLLILIQQCGEGRNWDQGEIEFAERVGRQLVLSLANLNDSRNMAGASVEPETEGNRFRELIDNLPDAVIGLDEHGRISFINQQASAMFGLDQRDIGHPPNSVDAMAMTDDYFWSRVIACKEVSHFEGHLKPKGRRLANSQTKVSNPGDKTPLNVSVAPLPTPDGIINGYLVSLTDVSHVQGRANGISDQLVELNEERLRIEKNLADMKAAELQARARIEKLNSIAGVGKNVTEEIRRLEAELAKERARFRQQEGEMQQTLNQQVAINRMKNEFIVNSGRDISRSLQVIINNAETLKNGGSGLLNPNQQQLVDSLLKQSRETFQSVNDLIEYGASRSQ
jgi:PAS domain S-box-containing protein